MGGGCVETIREYFRGNWMYLTVSKSYKFIFVHIGGRFLCEFYVLSCLSEPIWLHFLNCYWQP